MAKPPRTRTLQAAEGTPPPWWNGLATFIRETADALTRNLTFSENISSQWVEMEFSDTVTSQTVRAPDLRGRAPNGVLLANYAVLTGTAPTVTPAYTWSASGDQVRVALVTVLAAGTRLKITFLVLPE